jgi:modification methylase
VRPAPADAAAGSPTKRDAPRVPFGSLVERGLVPAGTVLMDKQRRVRAVVAADGSLTAGAVRGSIHQVGAQLTHAPSCNGWTFWYLEREGGLVPLDTIRVESAAAE